MSVAAVLLCVAILFAPGPHVVRRRIGLAPTRSVPVRRAGIHIDPLATASAFDVFAVCLAGGMSVSAAAAATAPSAPDHLATVLRRAADLLALGADPDTAWSPQPGEHSDALARLARRSASSGSALAQGVAELAEQSRLDAGHAASASAERASVLIAGPLGLCFLPAFVCLGIVPVVAGLAGDVFASGIV